MKSMIIICLLVGLLVHSSEGVSCVCKCCDTDGCDTLKAEPRRFQLEGVCNDLNCNRLSCSANIKTCPNSTSAGNVESACDTNKRLKTDEENVETTAKPDVSQSNQGQTFNQTTSLIFVSDANAIQTPLLSLGAVLIGTFMAWKLY